MDSFKGYPTSVTEARSNKTQNAKDWTPRDALIACLRDIDEGREVPIDIVISMATKEPSGDVPGTRAWHAGPGGIHERLGLLERVKYLINVG